MLKIAVPRSALKQKGRSAHGGSTLINIIEEYAMRSRTRSLSAAKPTFTRSIKQTKKTSIMKGRSRRALGEDLLLAHLAP